MSIKLRGLQIFPTAIFFFVSFDLMCKLLAMLPIKFVMLHVCVLYLGTWGMMPTVQGLV